MGCERKYSVYMHRNRFDDKKYFGITCRPLDKRWGHGLGYKKQSRFYNAILKYGWDEGFDHVILAVDLTEECSKDIERLLIAVFNTQNREFGYNLTAGGDENPCHSEHWRETMNSVEYRKKQSEKQKEIWSTPELKQKRSDANKRNWSNVSFAEKFYKRVVCVETGVTYDCINSAGRILHLDVHNISSCCRGKRATVGGYHWEYVDEELKNKYVPYASKHKRVLCVETGVIYLSASCAASFVGVTRSRISACCRGRQKTAGGYHWEYA